MGMSHGTAAMATIRTAALLVALALSLARAGASAEGTRTLVVDAAESHIRFFATSRFVDAEGRFGRFEGTLVIDLSRPAAAAGRLVIDVASIDTRNGLRDSHLRSSDFLDVDRHPTASFVTTAVQPGEREWTVTGQLTIRGVSRSITVPVAVSPAAGALRVTGELTINRRDFGIAYDSVLNPIGDQVRVRVELVARPA